MVMMEGLIVKQPFADLIINGQKSWELRSKSAPEGKINKEILLLSKGEALGKIKITKCFKTTKEEIIKNTKKHQSEIDKNSDLYYNHVWKIKVMKKFSSPKPYEHPMGARVWVKNVDYRKQSKMLHFL